MSSAMLLFQCLLAHGVLGVFAVINTVYLYVLLIGTMLQV